jgi:hypothetical protein
MNCKQGDLAYVFKSQLGNYGKVVTCLELLPAGTEWDETLGPIWKINTPIVGMKAIGGERYQSYTIPDIALRPLRGDLSGDEIEQKQPLASVFTA